MEDLTPQTVAVLRVLLRKFRSLRELWDAQHKHYGDLNRVEAGYANLLKILLITEPNANTTSVFSKIHGFINAFAKEYSENKRRTRGNCSWYVEELQFLVDAKLVCNDDSVTADLSWLQKPPGMSSNFVDDLSTANISCLESSENLNCIIVTEQNTGPMEDTLRMEVDIKLEEDERTGYTIKSYLPKRCPPTYKVSTFDVERNTGSPVPAGSIPPLAVKTTEHIFARSLAIRMKKLDRVQHLLAEKLISDIVFAAELRDLSVKNVTRVRQALKK
uniref:MADF domain-containing protein n=1 Tax=Anopheles atroparvus TaxID=41427 RepID=A0AAG5DMD4_ANOAO